MINVTGGTGGDNYYGVEFEAIGGNGGNGTASCGNVSTGTYQEYIENVE